VVACSRHLQHIADAVMKKAGQPLERLNGREQVRERAKTVLILEIASR